MINTGITQWIPGESGYSRIRGLYQANISQKLTDEQIISELELITSPKPSELYKTANTSKFFKIHKLLNCLYRSKFMVGLDMNTKIELTFFIQHYRPKKHCPQCSQAEYHTYLFDYEFVTRCPVHGVKLLKQCPECKKSWPTNNEAKIRRCLTCGISNSFKWKRALLLKLTKSNPIVELEKILANAHLKVFPKIHLLQIHELFNYQRNNINVPSIQYFSALLEVNYKSELINKLMNKFGIVKCKIKTKKFEVPRRKISALNKFDAELIVIKQFSLDKVTQKINVELSKLISDSHSLGSCICSEGACHICSIWVLWLILSRNKAENCEFLEFYMLQAKMSPVLRHSPPFDMSDFRVKSMKRSYKTKPQLNDVCHITKDFELFLLELDYLQIANQLFLHMKNLNVKRGNLIAWELMHKQFLELVESGKGKYQNLMIKTKGNELTLFYEPLNLFK